MKNSNGMSRGVQWKDEISLFYYAKPFLKYTSVQFTATIQCTYLKFASQSNKKKPAPKQTKKKKSKYLEKFQSIVTRIARHCCTSKINIV